MATQSTTDQAPQMSGSSSDLDSMGEIILGGQYKPGYILRKESHATVYSISSITASDASSEEEFETRIYDMEDIPDQLRKYRLRNIKRLSSRTVLEVLEDGLIVVVYKVEGSKFESSKDGLPVETASEEKRRGEKTQQSKPKEKSDLQREKERLRQSERRKTRRTEQRLKAGSIGSESEAFNQLLQETTDEEKALQVSLLSQKANSYRPELCQQLLPPSHLRLQNDVQEQPLQFEDASVYQIMQGGLELFRHVKEDIEQIRVLIGKEQELKRRIAFHNKLSKEVVPISGSCSHTMSALQAESQEEVIQSDIGNGRGVMAIYESFKDELETLLTSLRKDLHRTSLAECASGLI